MDKHKLPLGILKQITLKFDSVLSDINELLNSDIDESEKNKFMQMKEIVHDMLSATYSTVQTEMDEDEFANMYIEMDDIEDIYNPQPEIE